MDDTVTSCRLRGAEIHIASLREEIDMLDEFIEQLKKENKILRIKNGNLRQENGLLKVLLEVK